MNNALHITSGDCAGGSLAKAGLPGKVFVWHDVLYDGPRCLGRPDEATLDARAVFLETFTGGGLDRQYIRNTLRQQYETLAEASASGQPIVLWFDACLFDQSMLAHILMCLQHQNARNVTLLCVGAFPGVEPFHGLGQLQPDQLASLYGNRQPVTAAQYDFAVRVDGTFAIQDSGALSELAWMPDAPLPWIPAAVRRWLQEKPDGVTGLGRLEALVLNAIRAGLDTPAKILASVAAAETPPQFWGDTTLWAKINALAERDPPLAKVEGPAARLPQWESDVPLNAFRIQALPSGFWRPNYMGGRQFLQQAFFSWIFWHFPLDLQPTIHYSFE